MANNDKSKVAKKKYGGKVAKMEAGGEAIEGSTNRPLTNSEKKRTFLQKQKTSRKGQRKSKDECPAQA